MIAIVFMFWVSFVALVGFCGYVILRAILALLCRLWCHCDVANNGCCGSKGECLFTKHENEDTADKKVERCPGCGCDDDCFCECEYCPKRTKNEGQES
jgi:hypothetical protein